jgi:hypothetical protein
MRKVAILAGLLLAAAFLPAGPAKAEVMLGCSCVKFGAPVVCTATVADCNLKVGGVCLAPCTYEPPKKMAKRHGHKKKKKM